VEIARRRAGTARFGGKVAILTDIARVELGYFPDSYFQRDCLRATNAAIATATAMSSHESKGRMRKTDPIFALVCPKATSP